MILVNALRKVLRFMTSAWLALVLLVFVGLWSVIGAAVPQSGTAPQATIEAWAAKYRLVEPLVNGMGLHRAFSAPAFVVALILLGVSTILCSWNRTIAAAARGRYLRSASRLEAAGLAERHDLDVVVRPGLDRPAVLEGVRRALKQCGVGVRDSGDVLASVSSPWSVWGSPIFHWALVGLIVSAFAGTLLRSEGSMIVPVGDIVRDRPTSYVALSQGRWHDWSRVKRSIQVVAFDPALTVDGIDRGAVPTVAVLNALGKPIAQQQVYPNMKLHAGSLSISAPGVGLTARLTMLDASGAELSQLTQLIAFSQTTAGGTAPLSPVMLRDSSGQVALRLYATVPLERATDGRYGEWIPKQPAARIVLHDGAGTLLADNIVPVGGQVSIPGGGAIRVDNIGWFSRLAVVDDPTIPFIYATMLLACLGLTLTLITRQQVVAAAVLEEDGRMRVVVRVRLWRNSSTTKEEIAGMLSREVGEAGPDGTSAPLTAREEGADA